MHFTNPEHSIMCQQQRRGQDKAFGSTVLVVYRNKPRCGTARSVGICNVGGFRGRRRSNTTFLFSLPVYGGFRHRGVDMGKRKSRYRRRCCDAVEAWWIVTEASRLMSLLSTRIHVAEFVVRRNVTARFFVAWWLSISISTLTLHACSDRRSPTDLLTAAANQPLQIRIGCVVDGGLDRNNGGYRVCPIWPTYYCTPTPRIE